MLKSVLNQKAYIFKKKLAIAYNIGISLHEYFAMIESVYYRNTCMPE